MKQRTILEILREEQQMGLHGGLYHETQIRFSYNTNRIEGSHLTEEQTRYIFETSSFSTAPHEIALVDDILETVNHFSCFDYMLRCATEKLSEDIIKRLHFLLKVNTTDSRKDWFQVGEYKKLANVVGNIKTSEPKDVPKKIQTLLNSYNNKEKVLLDDLVDFHHMFETIHPFQDGNGRVGRLILFKECLCHNIVPFIIDNEHKLYYYRGLAEYKTEKGFLRDTCLSAQDTYKALVTYFSPEKGQESKKTKQRADDDSHGY